MKRLDEERKEPEELKNMRENMSEKKEHKELLVDVDEELLSSYLNDICGVDRRFILWRLVRFGCGLFFLCWMCVFIMAVAMKESGYFVPMWVFLLSGLLSLFVGIAFIRSIILVKQVRKEICAEKLNESLYVRGGDVWLCRYDRKVEYLEEAKADKRDNYWVFKIDPVGGKKRKVYVFDIFKLSFGYVFLWADAQREEVEKWF